MIHARCANIRVEIRRNPCLEPAPMNRYNVALTPTGVRALLAGGVSGILGSVGEAVALKLTTGIACAQIGCYTCLGGFAVLFCTSAVATVSVNVVSVQNPQGSSTPATGDGVHGAARVEVVEGAPLEVVQGDRVNSNGEISVIWVEGTAVGAGSNDSVRNQIMQR